jgi:hypothetical protein
VNESFVGIRDMKIAKIATIAKIGQLKTFCAGGPGNYQNFWQFRRVMAIVNLMTEYHPLRLTPALTNVYFLEFSKLSEVKR